MQRFHFRSGLESNIPRRAVFLVPVFVLAFMVFGLWGGSAAPAFARPSESPEYLVVGGPAGRPGGRLVVALRAEPATFNPVYAGDVPSRTVVGRLTADLIHLNRETFASEPALARSWEVSPDGRRFTLELRRGIRFSDGHPFDADDVVFTFQVYLDERTASRFRPQLTVGGKPLRIEKLAPDRVAVELAQPYGVGVQLFDSIAILPAHRLREAYAEGRLNSAWGVGTKAEDVVGLGPFRLSRYLPGERLVLERNPYYWKVDGSGQRLPYLDEIVVLFVPSEEAQLTRFESGELDVIERLTPESFDRLEDANGGAYELYDAGAGFVFHFLFFNLNDLDSAALPEIARKQAWFRDPAFRRAVSLAVDREGILRLVYRRRGAALASHVTPGNKAWLNTSLTVPERSIPEARRLLAEAGYSWDAAGRLTDAGGERVEFTLATNSSSSERVQMATLIAEDLRLLGMEVRPAPIEFGSLTDRVLKTYDYEAAILGLTDGVDPIEVMNVWSSDGDRRLWRLARKTPEPAWQAEIDRLMQEQVTTIDRQERKRLYDRVQAILAENQPCILLVSPNVLTGADRRLGRFAPTVFEHVTLWNADELHWKNDGSGSDH